jgi:hypothetical protein
MSYQEKNTTVSLMSSILILGFYVVNLLQMYREGGLVSERLFRLWAIVIVAGILANIFASILTNIVLSIVHAIQTGNQETERYIEDERDQLIGLKGTRHSYIAFSVGVLLSMLAYVLGQPPLVMFSLIVLSGVVAEIIGDISKISLYRRGF